MDRCRTDGRPGSRLYMCTPILGDPPTTDLDSEAGTPRPSSFCGSRSSADTEHQETESDSQQPSMEFPSTVVPIDVSGHPFKRMTSFRRSLIHVDFLIRRKKKKKAKRRNTVAEGDTKELAEALQQVTIGNHTAAIPTTSSQPPEDFQGEDPVNRRGEEEETTTEENNNSYSRGESRNPCTSKSGADNVDLKVSREWRPGKKGKNSDQVEKKAKDPSGCKKKSRGYIPISTLSAAMTVAVKMRQTFSGNKTEDAQSSSGNWSGSSSGRASLDSDQQRTCSASAAAVTSPTHSLISKDSLLSENTRSSKDSRIVEGVPVTNTLQRIQTASGRESVSQREEEENHIYSSLDAEQGTASEMDGEESTASSLDTDGYFPSYPTDNGLRTGEERTESFESDDDDDSNICYLEDKYGSSASLSTISNGSLNSLLSRTATELSSSSSTLTWTFKSPPPPPPRVSSVKGDDEEEEAAAEDDDVSKTERKEESDPQPKFSSVAENEVSKVHPVLNGNIQNKMISNSIPDPAPNERTISDYAVPKTVYEEHKGPKTILSNLIKKKFHSKEEHRKEKSKHNEKVKQHSKKSPPRFSMYGDHSPSKTQLTPSFIQGRRSPVVAEEPKSPLISFVPNSSQQQSFRAESPQVSSSSPPCQQESKFESSPEPSPTVPETVHQPTIVSNSNPESPVIYSEIKTTTVRAPTPVPLKYAHQITVTPVRRQPKTENVGAQTASNVCPRSPESHYASNSPTCSSQSSGERKPVHVNPDQSNYAVARRGPVVVQSNHHCNSSPEAEESQTNSRVSPENFQPYLQNSSTRPQRPSSLASDYPCKPAARVILDPEGRVIFSSNSLDRRRVGYQSMHSQSFSPEPPSDSKFATLPMMCQNQAVNSYYEEFSPVTSQAQNSVHNYTVSDSRQEHYHHSPYPPVSEHHVARGRGHYIPASVNDTYNSHRLNGISVNSRSSPTNFYSSTGCQFAPQERNVAVFKGFSPSSDVSRATDASEYLNSMPVNRNLHSPSGLRSPPVVPSPYHPSSHHAIVSLSPHYPSPLTQQNVTLHSQRMSRLSPSSECTSNVSSSSEYSYDLMSPPPFTPIRYGPSISPCSDIQQQKRKPMTTEDLFAVIHNSKKKLNIKTDSDISVTPSSSRSSSPSYNRSVPSIAGTPKGGLAETGFLSPRSNSGSQGSARDRRSWADFRSPPGSVGERRCLASDRMGPNKPTSMHDFKMLLLQARSTNQSSGARVSAVEQLMKVPVSQTQYHYSPTEQNSLHTNSAQNSPTAEMCFYNGHSTVPFKRSSRARASLQARYVMYPPIFEDCSEEAESSRDPQKSPVLKAGQPKTDDCSGSGLHPSSHVTYNRCATPLQPVPQGEFAASSMWV